MGGGKTTFLKMWSQHLRNEKFPVIEVNVWQTDFSEDPFVALYTELATNLNEKMGAGLSQSVNELNKAAQMVFQVLAMAINYKTGMAVDPGKLWKKTCVRTAKTRRVDEYQEAKKAFQEFKEKLGDVARKLVDGKNIPLMVMIDELDRCRPSYAVEFLETAKHLFSVDQVIFVLAVNQEQLEHAVKTLYGYDSDGEKYLRRFFDIDFRLPEPKRDRLITKLLESTGITEIITKPS